MTNESLRNASDHSNAIWKLSTIYLEVNCTADREKWGSILCLSERTRKVNHCSIKSSRLDRRVDFFEGLGRDLLGVASHRDGAQLAEEPRGPQGAAGHLVDGDRAFRRGHRPAV